MLSHLFIALSQGPPLKSPAPLQLAALHFELVWSPMSGKDCDQVVTPATISWRRGYVIHLGVPALS